MMIIYPDFSESNGIRLSKNLNVKSAKIHTRVFPNGEVVIRLDDVDKIREEDRFLIFFPTYPDTNNRVIALLQTLDTLAYYNRDADKILLQPYLSYSRQDKRFLEGEALSLKIYLELLCHLGVDHLIVFDVHSLDSFKKYVCCDYTHITLYEYLLEKIMGIHRIKGEGDLILVAPDEGRLDTVKKLSKKYNYNYIYLEKKRDLYTGSVEMSMSDDVDLNRYKFALLVDDEISTGGTMSLATKYLMEKGAKNIIVSAIHLLLVSNADDRLFNAGVGYLYGTNTVDNPYSIIYIEDIVAKKILNW